MQIPATCAACLGPLSGFRAFVTTRTTALTPWRPLDKLDALFGDES